MRSLEMFMRVYFCSGVGILGTTCSQTWRMFTTSGRIPWQLPTEIPTNDAIWSTDFLVSLPTIHRTRSTLLHLLVLRASTTGIIVNTLVSNMQAFMLFIHLKFVIVLSLQPCCKMVNVSSGDFCRKKILNSYILQVVIFNINKTTRTINKQSKNKWCYAIRGY